MSKFPAVSSKKFCKFLFKIGCDFIRTEGDHDIFWKKGIIRPIVVPIRKVLPTFIVFNNIRTLGISREEFLRLLKNL